MNTREFFEGLRHVIAWPGGYGPARLLMSDGETLCHECAYSERFQIGRSTRDGAHDGWAAQAWFIHWEGPPEYCAHCGDELPSEYGDPDKHEESTEIAADDE